MIPLLADQVTGGVMVSPSFKVPVTLNAWAAPAVRVTAAGATDTEVSSGVGSGPKPASLGSPGAQADNRTRTATAPDQNSRALTFIENLEQALWVQYQTVVGNHRHHSLQRD